MVIFPTLAYLINLGFVKWSIREETEFLVNYINVE